MKLVEDCRSESIINGIEGRNNKSQTSQSPIDKQIYKWGKRIEKTDNNRTSFLCFSPTSLPPLLGPRTAAPHRSSDSALGARPSSASEGKSLQRGRCSGGPMRRGERVLIFASSLSSNAKWIPHMHPLLEADAYCYSTFREAFLPLRSRMRPLLEIALKVLRLAWCNFSELLKFALLKSFGG